MEQSLAGDIEKWLTFDKNEETRNELSKLRDNKSWDILRRLLQNRMVFGTAGLRAKMGPGNSQMNDVTIIQTTQGLLKYAKSVFPQLNSSGVIVGYDGRHNSQKWAHITANIFVNAGCKVYLYREFIPTPLVAFGVRHFKTSLGIMITASHNPKCDNGYKVYWSNGAQIISPHDKGIAKCIDENLTPLESSWKIDNVGTNPLCINPMPQVLDAYSNLQKDKICYTPSTNPIFNVPIVYTAMHGVGWETVKFIVNYFGFKPLIPVTEQVQPDPDFPTVTYPNPEEGHSALDLAIKSANTVSAPIILANDPDADRLAVAEKQTDGSWKILTGNELGALLGWWLWTNWRRCNPYTSPTKVAMLSSTVSSQILRSMAKVEGFHYEETLTGFKWMGNRASELEKQGIQTIFAFEEAIGFMCGDAVLDKDGIGALAVVTELIAHTYGGKSSLTDQLEKIYDKYGQHVTINSYYFCHDPTKIVAMFDRLRNWPIDPSAKGYPQNLGRFRIIGVRDLTIGYDNNYADLKPRLPVSTSSQCITFTFAQNIVLTIRTSGTEPKIKYYSEYISCDSGMDVTLMKGELQKVINLMIEQFYEPHKNNLLPPAA